MSIRATVIFAQINYVKPRATDIHLITDLKQYFYYETATLSDVAAIITTKPRNDDFAIADLAYVNIQKAETDGLSITESVDLLANFQRSINDNITITMATDFVSSTNQGYEETASIDDLIGLYLQRPVTGDSFGITDQAMPVLNKGINEAISFSETVALVMAYSKYYNDSVSMQEQAALSYAKTVSDAFALDDATLVNKDYDGNKGNVIGLTETISMSRTFGRAFGNSTLNSITLN